MLAKIRSGKSQQEEQIGTDPKVHGSSEIRKRKEDQGVRTCAVCVPAQSRRGKETQVVRGLASVLKVLEDIHTCSEWIKCQGIG